MKLPVPKIAALRSLKTSDHDDSVSEVDSAIGSWRSSSVFIPT